MRWNPSTKMVQVCDGGTWYDKEYFNPQWDGYIFNNGVYNTNYFEDNWNNYVDTSGGASPSNLKYPSVVTNKITSKGDVNSLYYCQLYSMNAKAFHVDRPCTITFDIEYYNAAYDATAKTGYIYIKNNANANASGILKQSSIVTATTQVTINLTDSQYIGQDVYYGFTYRMGTQAASANFYLNILAIHVDYIE